MTLILHKKLSPLNLEGVEQEDKIGYAVEKERYFTYLGERVSTGGACEAAVTARRNKYFKFQECGE